MLLLLLLLSVVGCTATDCCLNFSSWPSKDVNMAVVVAVSPAAIIFAVVFGQHVLGLFLV